MAPNGSNLPVLCIRGDPAAPDRLFRLMGVLKASDAAHGGCKKLPVIVHFKYNNAINWQSYGNYHA